ncbi:hypothetical protein OKW26_005296 [Paraburkholderia sp. 32]
MTSKLGEIESRTASARQIETVIGIVLGRARATSGIRPGDVAKPGAWDGAPLHDRGRTARLNEHGQTTKPAAHVGFATGLMKRRMRAISHSAKRVTTAAPTVSILTSPGFAPTGSTVRPNDSLMISAADR